MLLSACGSAAPPARVAAPTAQAPTAPAAATPTDAPAREATARPPFRADPAMPTPCFRGDPPLEALQMYTRLEQFAHSLFDDPETPAPKGGYGTCTVERNVVRDETGMVVAELGCGVRVMVPGILDDVGVEIGALGQDVLDRRPEPLTPMWCTSNGPKQARCSFERRPGSDVSESSYVVEGDLPAGVEMLRGDPAKAFFAERKIVELHVSFWCH